MKWKHQEPDQNLIKQYSEKFELSKKGSIIVANRENNSDGSIVDFLDADMSKLRNPYTFEKMNLAIEKILEARNNKEKVVIYGDYDVDGITAVAYLYIVFREVGINVDYFIPRRMEEGYGLNKTSIDHIKNNIDGKLIVTVDVGINLNEEIQYAKDMGVDIIITDHHKMLVEHDEDITIINPKVSKKYKFSALSGAGVAFKLAEALFEKLNKDKSFLYDYMDIVMIGTVADVVSMVDENRLIIKKGLEVINRTKIKGLRYLFRYLKLLEKEITTTDVSFFISPMLNALGRISDSNIGVEFFLEDDEFNIYNLIEEMKKANKKRRSLERQIFGEIISKIGSTIEEREYIFLESNRWHSGVIGVVAARLSLRYNISVLLISVKGGVGKASCRSVEGINIFEILKTFSEDFIRFGGHDLAAGFIAKQENISKIEKSIAEKLTINEKEKHEKEILIDMELELDDLNDNFIGELKRLSPFGAGNSHPVFCTKNVYFVNPKKFGVENQHFKAYIMNNNKSYSVVGFNLGDKLDNVISQAQNFNIVYYPERTYLNGEEILQLKLIDFKLADEFGAIFA